MLRIRGSGQAVFVNNSQVGDVLEACGDVRPRRACLIRTTWPYSTSLTPRRGVPRLNLFDVSAILGYAHHASGAH